MVEVGLAVGGQLVRLVEDDEVVGLDASALASRANIRSPGERVDADDESVAAPARRTGCRPGLAAATMRNGEAEEQLAQLALPVADQTGRRHDQHAPDEPARKHLADVEAGHDRLAGAGVVGQQEPQRRLGEHVLVDGDPLVRQRVDQRDLGGEGRIEEVAEGEASCFGHCGDHARRRREIKR